MTASPAAGPLTWSGAPPIAPTRSPPTIPVTSPATGGAPDAIAIPMQSGRATKKTTTDARRSRPSHFGERMLARPWGSAPRMGESRATHVPARAREAREESRAVRERDRCMNRRRCEPVSRVRPQPRDPRLARDPSKIPESSGRAPQVRRRRLLRASPSPRRGVRHPRHAPSIRGHRRERGRDPRDAAPFRACPAGRAPRRERSTRAGRDRRDPRLWCERCG